MGFKIRFDKDRLSKILEFLKKYIRIPVQERFKVKLDRLEIDYCSEIILNFLNKNIQPSSTKIELLKKFKPLLYKIIDKKTSRRVKSRVFSSVKGVIILHHLLPHAINAIQAIII